MVESMYKPHEQGGALPYMAAVEALGTIPRVMIARNGWFQECIFEISQEGRVIGDGSVKLIRSGPGQT